MLYGTIIGDIVGSRFEFDRPNWRKDFELFTDESKVTDDSVMAVAVAKAIFAVGEHPTEKSIKSTVIKEMQTWGRRYPGAGYGANFIRWLQEKDPKPYNSFGNGSAMRTAAVGWMYEDLGTTRWVARWVAEVSHNHPEGIKGAECISSLIWMARIGYNKNELVKWAVDEFGYDLSMSVDELIPLHRHDESCMDSVPKAIIAFYESTDFESAIRNAVAMGGDTDTIAAITGSIAEAFYGVPEELKEKSMEYLPLDLEIAVDIFESANW